MGDGIAPVYGLDSCMAGELLAFAASTLVLDSLVMNSNFNTPIPVGSGYAGRYINASGVTS